MVSKILFWSGFGTCLIALIKTSSRIYLAIMEQFIRRTAS